MVFVHKKMGMGGQYLISNDNQWRKENERVGPPYLSAPLVHFIQAKQITSLAKLLYNLSITQKSISLKKNIFSSLKNVHNT